MKQFLDIKRLPLVLLSLGLLGHFVWMGLYSLAMDEKGLLARNHPLEWVLWLLTALAVGLALFAARKQDGTGNYGREETPSGLRALWTVLLALAVGLDTWLAGPGMDLLAQVGFGWGMLTAVILLWIAALQLRGRKPHFLLYCVACVYFALYMVNHYRAWSGNSQLLDYVFALMAVVCVSLYVYQQAACCLDTAKLPTLWFSGLLAVFFGFMSGKMLFLSAACWCFSDLCHLNPVAAPEKPKAAEEAPGEESL